MIRIIGYIVLLFSLSGCAALPPALTYLGYIKTGADGISYLTTRKSTTDHLLSSALEQDCAFHRVLWQEDVCHQNDNFENIALLKKQALDTHPAAGKPN